jgi:hypothetical protein
MVVVVVVSGLEEQVVNALGNLVVLPSERQCGVIGEVFVSENVAKRGEAEGGRKEEEEVGDWEKDGLVF